MSAEKPHLRLRKHLDQPAVPHTWPAGIAPQLLQDIDPRLAHAVLVEAFPGLVAAFDDWHGNLTRDSEYDPSLCIAAVADDGSVVGFVQSWTSNFIKDLAVLPAWRRHGVGEALMRYTFHLFNLRGAHHVDLKVKTDEVGARRLYARLGMVDVI